MYKRQESNEGVVTIVADMPGELLSDNLVLHLESDHSTSESGEVVDKWPDQSGFGNDLSAVGAPSLLPNVLNGLPVLDFDGVDDALLRNGEVSGLPVSDSDRTVFFLVNYRGIGYGGFAYGQPRSNQAFGAIVSNTDRLACLLYTSPSPRD